MNNTIRNTTRPKLVDYIASSVLNMAHYAVGMVLIATRYSDGIKFARG